MNLTEQDIIQLKKETFLFEHGFYDKEYAGWLDSFKWEEREQLQRTTGWTLCSKLNGEKR